MRVLFPANPNLDFREVHAECSRNFREKLRYYPGFPASAVYDDVSHNLVAESRQNFRVKNIISRYHCETFGKPSLSILVVVSNQFHYTNLSVDHHIACKLRFVDGLGDQQPGSMGLERTKTWQRSCVASAAASPARYERPQFHGTNHNISCSSTTATQPAAAYLE